MLLNYSMRHATWHCARRPGRLLQRNTHLHKHTGITHSAKQGARRREPPLNDCASQFQALIYISSTKHAFSTCTAIDLHVCTFFYSETAKTNDSRQTRQSVDHALLYFKLLLVINGIIIIRCQCQKINLWSNKSLVVIGMVWVWYGHGMGTSSILGNSCESASEPFKSGRCHDDSPVLLL